MIELDNDDIELLSNIDRVTRELKLEGMIFVDNDRQIQWLENQMTYCIHAYPKKPGIKSKSDILLYCNPLKLITLFGNTSKIKKCTIEKNTKELYDYVVEYKESYKMWYQEEVDHELQKDHIKHMMHIHRESLNIGCIVKIDIDIILSILKSTISDKSCNVTMIFKQASCRFNIGDYPSIKLKIPRKDIDFSKQMFPAKNDYGNTSTNDNIDTTNPSIIGVYDVARMINIFTIVSKMQKYSTVFLNIIPNGPLIISRHKCILLSDINYILCPIDEKPRMT